MNALKPIDFLVHELDLFFAFSWRDWSTSIIPSLIFSIGAARSSGLPPPLLCYRYILLLQWTTLFIYSFTLSNQITGVLEDQINKPDRPLASGKVTLKGAKDRHMLSVVAYFAVALYHPSVLPETVCWVLTTAFLSLTPAGNHWFGKNCVAMVAGTWAQFNACWKIITPTTEQSTRYVWAFAFWFALAAHIQDLRDIKGDAAMGRKTLCLAFGDREARLLIALIAIPLQVLVLWFGGIAQIAPEVLGIAHVIVGWRVMQAGRGSEYDHKTYMIYTYTACLIIACAALGPIV